MPDLFWPRTGQYFTDERTLGAAMAAFHNDTVNWLTGEELQPSASSHIEQPEAGAVEQPGASYSLEGIELPGASTYAQYTDLPPETVAFAAHMDDVLLEQQYGA